MLLFYILWFVLDQEDGFVVIGYFEFRGYFKFK